jgi:hypothetical protein
MPLELKPSIVNHALPNNFLEFALMSPSVVENQVIPFNSNPSVTPLNKDQQGLELVNLAKQLSIAKQTLF